MISIEGLKGVPQIRKKCDFWKILLDTINNQKFDLKMEIFCAYLLRCVP
jgi:hypothetical protein